MVARKELALTVNLPDYLPTAQEWEALYQNKAFLFSLNQIKRELVRLRASRPSSPDQAYAEAYEAAGLTSALKQFELAEGRWKGAFGGKADNGE